MLERKEGAVGAGGAYLLLLEGGNPAPDPHLLGTLTHSQLSSSLLEHKSVGADVRSDHTVLF